MNPYLKVSLITLATLTTACGALTSSTGNLSQQQQANTNPGSVLINNSGITGTPATSSGAAPVSISVQATGYTSVALNVTTGSVLKMRFIPSLPTSEIYNHLGVYVTVGSLTLNTGMLRNGADGLGPADTSQLMDFSSAVQSCGSSGCRQSVQFQVSKPNYDYWCLNYMLYCPWNHVSQTDSWNGNMIIQTDDTQSI